MAQPSKKNMLLLSGSTAAGNVPDGVTPGFLDFAEPWITALFAHAAHEKQPILFVPYARPGGMSEAAYFTRVQERLGSMGLVLPWLLRIRPILTPVAGGALVIVMVGAVAITALDSLVGAAILSTLIFPLVALRLRRWDSEAGKAWDVEP